MGDNQALARSAVQVMAYGEEGERLKTAEEFSDFAGQGVSTFTQAGIWANAAVPFFNHRHRDRYEAMQQRLRDYGERTREPLSLWMPTFMDGILALLDGKPDLVSELMEQVDAKSLAAGMGGERGLSFASAMPAQRALWYRGQSPRTAQNPANDEIMQLFGVESNSHTDSDFVRNAVLADRLGGPAAQDRHAGAVLRAMAEGRSSDSSVDGATTLLEAAVLTNSTTLLPDLVTLTGPFADLIPHRNLTSSGRYLGDACALLERWDEARAYYDQAMAACEKLRFRPELALTHAHLAELLLDHYPDERDAAIQRLDFAIAEFQDMKMQPALEGALGRRGLLKA